MPINMVFFGLFVLKHLNSVGFKKGDGWIDNTAAGLCQLKCLVASIRKQIV